MRSLLIVATLAALSACATPHPTTEATAPAAPAMTPPATVVNAPERSDADRALDPGRKPLETLAFLKVPTGGHVAELGAGGGYTTELLSLAVGPSGVVYGQNSPMMLKKFAEKPWSERLARPELKNVVRLDRDFEDPFPPEATNLDLVVIAYTYHDLVWVGVDRARMNAAVFKALKPGGRYVVLDHQSRPGAGLSDVQTFHRIEEKTLVDEVEKAGFKLADEGDFLKNPADTHDWNDSPREAGARRGTSDRFAVAFVKPQ